MDKELSLKSLIRIWTKKYKLILFVSILLSFIALFISRFLMVPMYSSETKILVGPKPNANQQITLNQLQSNAELIETYKTIMFSDDILGIVRDRLNIRYSDADIRQRVTFYKSKDTQSFTVKVTDENPANAMNIANTLVEVFRERLDTLYHSNLDINVISYAKANHNKVSPNYKINMVLGFAAGIFICSSIIFILELIKPTVSGKSMMEAFSWINIGDIRSYKGNDKTVRRANLIGSDRTIDLSGSKLQVLSKEKKIKTILFTSASKESSINRLVRRLAKYFTMCGLRVLVVEMDKKNNHQAEAGTANVSHEPDPAIELNPEYFYKSMTGMHSETFLRTLESKYDFILIESESFVTNTTAQVLATKINHIVLHIKNNHSKLKDLIEIDTFCDDFKIDVLGYFYEN